jgi:sensor c-di-GMP phosphodiesterase-like protein
MFTKRRRTLLIIAAALTALLPPGAFVVVSYFETIHEADLRLARYAGLAIDRTDEILNQADSTLETLSLQVQPRCTPDTVEALRRVAYESIYFKEAGLIANGAVQCTSVRIYNPPARIHDADHAVLPRTGIHVSAPARSLEGPMAIIIGHGIDDDTGFDLLLNPAVIGEPLRKLFADDQVTLVLRRSDGSSLARIGAPADTPEDPAAPHVAARSMRYPVQAEAFVSPVWLRNKWLHNAYVFGGFGLIASALLFLALQYLFRRPFYAAAGLREAFANGEFRVYYQPVFRTDTGDCVGAEALLRWQHPQLGIVLPNLFVPAAQESGFIVPLTTWLMTQVATDLGPIAPTVPNFHVSMNLSPAHFLHPKLVPTIRDIFDQRLPPGHVIFEITEHQLIAGNDGPALEILQHIRATGARVALDDFGTGYSSLKYLSRYPFDYLKIDKAFIDAIGTESVTAGLTDTIVAMASQLKMRTVAEGVENRVQFEHLRRLGVDFVQGWLFAKAMPLDEFRQFLRSYAGGAERIARIAQRVA